MKTMLSISLLALALLAGCTTLTGKAAQGGRIHSTPADCYPGAAPECRGLSTG